jgi:hypothetical protein
VLCAENSVHKLNSCAFTAMMLVSGNLMLAATRAGGVRGYVLWQKLGNPHARVPH